MSTIRIDNVRKSFGGFEVVHGVSLDIADGEFVILVGPSGCGKSTLLRMIAGLESISSGNVVVDDLVINRLPPRERDIAMVFQSYALYPHMTVRRNMAFSLKLAGAPKGDIDRQVQAAAEILDLVSLLERKPAQLSGGQRQRVAMGRAIVRNPKLFLFDEPLSNLDAKLRVQMRSEIKELHQRLRTTTVYVTHDQVEAMTMADRIVVMNAGRIEQAGTPMDLYEKPASLFVAAFIGSPSMNLIHGRIEDSAFLSDAGARIPLAANAPVTSDPVVLGVRPESLHVGGVGPAFGECRLRVVEPMGSETLLAATLLSGGDGAHGGGENIMILSRVKERYAADTTVRVGADPGEFHFFDATSGRRLE
ncbi:ABC transporter ATP-binding protein [Wenxinia marina]|uniref:Carbohydrate ABC transporter ATP-binding protein, CUT1 family n=1 Tax=Wenxinia marina DSM 24838 TaxID=1123501 RepID=A0A0D0PC17_9RHOB|nr:sn-glycerol-3-phosphate ABC transporter ATP-binding protein UgpC [Wenxinia marina]KIQ69011.1 carbohydrate ABC transporter ATP-binding protein, CUT1 family [Wenxinia marina DSM 24838]GGL81092.1 ABC transporter ATP-binding protein [Wenxinia marina]